MAPVSTAPGSAAIPPDDGATASTEYLRLLAWAAEARGLAPAKILAAAGVNPALLEQRGARMPIEPVRRAWGEAVRRLDDPLFGLRAAEALSFGTLDLIDYLLRNSRTAGEAVTEVARYMPLMTNAGRVWLAIDGKEVRVRHWAAGAVPYISEMMVAVFARRTRELFGREWSLRSVSFIHAPLARRAVYDRHLRVPVRFGSAFDEAVFDRELMDLPVPGADARLKVIIKAQAEQAVAALAPTPADPPSSFVGAFERALSDGLDERDTTIVSLAERLGVSARTVQRRLREAGLSHRALVRRLRLEVARRALGGPRLSQQEIARALGYSGAGAFHRAFKRWAGMTPGAARAGGVARARGADV